MWTVKAPISLHRYVGCAMRKHLQAYVDSKGPDQTALLFIPLTELLATTEWWLESKSLDDTYNAQDHLNLQILHMFKGTFSLHAAHIVSSGFFPVQKNYFISIFCFKLDSLHFDQIKAAFRRYFCIKKTPLHKNLFTLTLVLLNPDMPCLWKQCRSRSVGFFRSTSALFVSKYANLYQHPESSNLIGWISEVGVGSSFIQHGKGLKHLHTNTLLH